MKRLCCSFVGFGPGFWRISWFLSARGSVGGRDPPCGWIVGIRAYCRYGPIRFERRTREETRFQMSHRERECAAAIVPQNVLAVLPLGRRNARQRLMGEAPRKQARGRGLIRISCDEISMVEQIAIGIIHQGQP